MTNSLPWDTIPIRAITSRLDPALPALFDIYQQSFPLEEQMRISFFLQMLEQKEQGNAQNQHLEVLAKDREVAGFVFYEVGEDIPEIGRGGYLWYLAAHPDIRGGGIGKRLYHHVKQEIFSRYGCRGLFFEIEERAETEQRHGSEAAHYAEWRKAWYKMSGCL